MCVRWVRQAMKSCERSCYKLCSPESLGVSEIRVRPEKNVRVVIKIKVGSYARHVEYRCTLVSMAWSTYAGNLLLKLNRGAFNTIPSLNVLP